MNDQNITDRNGRQIELKARMWRGLSGKVLMLTVIFVMLGEVMIFLPSIANFRITWLKSRIAMAEVAALASEAAPEMEVSDKLRRELLRGARVQAIAMKRDGVRQLVLRGDGDQMIKEHFDLRKKLWFGPVMEAFEVLFRTSDRLIGITDIPPNMSAEIIEVALHEKPLRDDMLKFSVNILSLSIILSLIVATMVFLAINYVLVIPLRQFTHNMLRFGQDPEDASRIIEASGRADELGIAERELQQMQLELSNTLQQKSRLASLGLAVSKVSHDLRNMLASAQLISDRLSMVDDPTVQKFAPKLITSLDRAIGFCSQTLKFGRASEAPPAREVFAVRQVVEEVIDTAIMQASSSIVLYNDTDDEVEIDADREQLFRILMNLVRNAVQALESAMSSGMATQQCEVHINAWRDAMTTIIEVRDNGPGVPEKARNNLFVAFRGGARAGGTGLGLAISHELARAHGGKLRLISEEGAGAVFHIIIPDRTSDAGLGKRGKMGVA